MAASRTLRNPREPCDLGEQTSHTTILKPSIRYRWEWTHWSRAERPVLHSRQPVATTDSLLKPLHHFQHKADYYWLLLDVTRTAAWEAWVKFIITAVEETASWTTAKVEAIRELQSKTVVYVREAAPKAHSHELMNLIFELPYCRIQNVTERKIAVRQTASGYLKELVRVGVLEEKVVGREKLFIHPR